MDKKLSKGCTECGTGFNFIVKDIIKKQFNMWELKNSRDITKESFWDSWFEPKEEFINIYEELLMEEKVIECPACNCLYRLSVKFIKNTGKTKTTKSNFERFF